MPSYFPEGEGPQPYDSQHRSLQKINSLLKNGTTVVGNIGLTASENHLGQVGGETSVITASVTRPNDTTAYAAGDAINSGAVTTVPLTFSSAARVPGGTGVIVHALMIDQANQATLLSNPELWLFAASFTASNDNAPWAPANADLVNAVGVIPLSTGFVGNPAAGASGNVVFVPGELSRPFKCTGGSQSLYGALVVRNAYTPVANELFTVRLAILQD